MSGCFVSGIRFSDPRTKLHVMRIISTRTHGLLDHILGFLLIGSPWFFGFDIGGSAQWTAIIVGAVIVLYSLVTHYEFGISSAVAMRTHLKLDFIAGFFLAISPWIFAFSDQVFVPYLTLGVFLVIMALASERKPFQRNRQWSTLDKQYASGRYHF